MTVTTKEQTPALVQYVESTEMEKKLMEVLPPGVKLEAFRRAAITCIRNDPKIMACTTASVALAIYEAASLGLTPDGLLGHAYIVPFKGVATLMIGWRGFIALARRSGEIAKVETRLVFEGDAFEFEYGSKPEIRHRPKGNDQGTVLYAYAIAFFKDGTTQFEVMSAESVENTRERSKAGNDGPWVTDWGEMARKTPLRKLSKYLPMQPNDMRAVVADEYREQGLQAQVKDADFRVIGDYHREPETTREPGETAAQAKVRAAAAETAPKPEAAKSAEAPKAETATPATEGQPDDQGPSRKRKSAKAEPAEEYTGAKPATETGASVTQEQAEQITAALKDRQVPQAEWQALKAKLGAKTAFTIRAADFTRVMEWIHTGELK